MTQTTESSAVATLGGGCFWCLEAVYDDMQGVQAVASGYMGGRVANPTYEQVCTGTTDHVEVVQVTYDPAQVSFRDLLEVFFTIHDPTTLNRQGADVGTQYRSAIFYHDAAQKETAELLIAELDDAQVWDKPIVTEVTPLAPFYPAEAYHQDYYENNAHQPYCQFVVRPKLEKFRQKFTARRKSK